MNAKKYSRPIYWISHILDSKIVYLERIISNKDEYYNCYKIRKKKKERRICEPNESLKVIQKRILKMILEPYFSYRLHKSSTGYERKISIINNARPHVNQKVILKVDIKDFFPSIKKDKVFRLFNSKFNQDVSILLTELCTYEGSLPQGAPTSPLISNYICYLLDKRIDCLAYKTNINYTRYSDDLTFSGKKIKRTFLKNVNQILEDLGFKINKNKIYWRTKKKAQKVTGIYVNDKISYGRKNLKSLSALIHNCSCGDLIQEKEKAFKEYGLKIKNLKSYLYGHVGHLNSVDPEKAKKLRKKLDSISNWEKYDLFEKENKKQEIHKEFMESIKKINSRFSEDLFIEDFDLPISLISPTTDWESFNTFSIQFSRMFTTMRISLLDQTLKNNEQINKLEDWFNRNNYEGIRICTPFRNIIKLSNHLERHKDREEVEKIFRKYSQKLSCPQFSELKRDLIKECIKSLKEIDQAIEANL